MVTGKTYSPTMMKKYCRLVGFFPYELIQDGDKVTVHFPKKYLIWSYFLGSTIIILGTTGTILSFISRSSEVYADSKKVQYVVHLNIMLNILNGAICMTYTTFNHRNINELINNIIKADTLLDNLNIPVRKNRWSKRLAILVVILIMVTFIVDSVFHFLVQDKFIFFKDVLRKIPHLGSHLSIAGQSNTFWSLVLMIRARICAMKKILSGYNYSLRADKKIMVQEFRSVIHQLRNAGKPNIKSLQEVYMCLFDAAKAIDELMRPFIVVTFVIRCFSLLILPFIMYEQIIVYKQNIFIFSQICKALIEISLLALIIEPACSCVQEYQKLRQELSTLLCYEEMSNADLDLLFDLVKDLPIEFNINDATPLKRILYVWILGSLTTYLVVLFEMKTT